MVSINVTNNIRGFLEEEILVTVCFFHAVDLSFTDEKFFPCIIAGLECFKVMHSNIALGLPLNLILIKTIKITGCIIKKDALWIQIVQGFGFLKLFYRFQESSFLIAVDYFHVLLSNRAKIHQKLHAHATGKQSLVRCFAHLKKELYAVVFLFPRQDIWVTFDDDNIYQVKTLLIVLRILT